ncbi:MAG: hypothetical protein V1663_02675 [archaeon]
MGVLKEKRGQVGTEFLIIVGFVIVVMVPITIMYLQYSGQSSDTVTASKVEHITNEIAAAASSVFAYGEGSQTKLTLDFPSNIKEIRFEGNEVIFIVINSQSLEQEIVQVTDVEFMGNSNIYVMPGKKDIIVKAVYDPVSQTNKVSVTMPCEDGDIRCCTTSEENQINNVYTTNYDCNYKCSNKAWILNSLCDSGSCTVGEDCVASSIDCQAEGGTCVQVYDPCPIDPILTYPIGICQNTLQVCCKGVEIAPACNDGDTQCKTGIDCQYAGFSVQSCVYTCLNNAFYLSSLCDSCPEGGGNCVINDNGGPGGCFPYAIGCRDPGEQTCNGGGMMWSYPPDVCGSVSSFSICCVSDGS